MSEKIYDKALESELLAAEKTATKNKRTPPINAEFIKAFAREVLQLIKSGLLRDGIVRVHNFGTFRLKMSAKRMGFNPQTREKIIIPQHARVVFTPAKQLRECVEGEHKPAVAIATEAALPLIVKPPAPPVAERPIAIKKPLVGHISVNQATETKSGNDDTETKVDITYPAHIARVNEKNPDTQQTSLSASNTASRTFATPENKQITQKPSDSLSTRSSIAEMSSTPRIARLQISDDELKPSFEKTPSPVKKPNRILIDDTLTEPWSSEHKATRIQNENVTETVALLEETPQKSRWPVIIAALVIVLVLLLWLIPKNNDPLEPVLAQSNTRSEPALNTEPAALPPVQLNTNSETTLNTEPAVIAKIEPQQAIEKIPLLSEKITPATRGDSLQAHYFARKQYRVVSGDNLWKLSSRHYINPFFWTHIYRENHSILPNPNMIEVKANIILPTLEGSPTQITANDRQSIAEGYFLMYQYYKKVGFKNAHYALIGVKWFDEAVLLAHDHEIDAIDKDRLNANRQDNQMIRSAMSKGIETLGNEE